MCSNYSEDIQHIQDKLYTTADSTHLILGFPTNVYVLWLIGNRGKLALDFFALNLTVADILTCMSSLMFILHDHIYCPQVESGPLWGTAIFFHGFVLAGRPLFQCCICLERYMAIVHPVTFLFCKPLRYRVGCCAVVWLLILGFCFAYWYKTRNALNDFTLGLIVVTFSVMLFCCLAVLRALKRIGPGEGDSDGMNNKTLRAFRIILFIMLTMVVMFLPLTVVLTMFHFLKPVNFSFGQSICFSVTVVTGFIEPLLYVHRAGKLPCIRGP